MREFLPVESTWGPAQRSSNAPCLYVVIGSPSGISWIISSFRGSSAFMSSARSFGYSCSSNGWSSAIVSRIASSIAPRSSLVKGSLDRKS